ncbi:hypothetical protein H0H92_007471 [Tricholoma furcatifolium]|nr:hypothetical protein H0H92_007471 [Tricholoma furcatifolium]
MFDDADRVMEDTMQYISTLEDRRTKLLQELSQVEKELLTAKAHHGKLTNQRLPISMLPNEVLSDIFQLCYGTKAMINRQMGRPFEVVASHVSTHWRSIALGTPLLWNNINLHITHGSRDHALQRMSIHLTRSSQCLLDISLHITVNDNVPEILQYLTPHAHRWYRVSVSTARGSPDDIYAAFGLLSTPNLIHLSLRIGNSEDESGGPRTEYPETCLPLLTRGSPMLTFVRVAGKVVGNLSPPLSTTRTLHVDAWPKNLMSLAQFQTFLTSLPCLIHLSLTGLSIHLPRDPFQVPQPINLPILCSLRLRGDSTPCHRLLSLLALPNLESLFLQGVGSFDSVVIPSLRFLTLESCSLSRAILRNVFRAFPRVATLGIDDSTPEIYPLLSPEDGEGSSSSSSIPWRELRSISLRRLPPTDVAPFTSMCLSRLDRGSPLQRIYLDKRSRNVLKSKGLLEDLRKLQPIENVDDLAPWPADLGYQDPDDAWY